MQNAIRLKVHTALQIKQHACKQVNLVEDMKGRKQSQAVKTDAGFTKHDNWKGRCKVCKSQKVGARPYI